MNLEILILKCLKKSLACFYNYNFYNERYCEIMGQEANNFFRNKIISCDQGLMVTKFGTTELGAVNCCRRFNRGFYFSDYIDYIRGKGVIDPNSSLNRLCNLSGFFPNSMDLYKKFVDLYLDDMNDIDILGSYIDEESYLQDKLDKCKKIDPMGYLTPYSWKNPWTSALTGKKVLVVHPFTDSISSQYEKRQFLFKDENVLPEFGDLFLVKAVQSIAGNGKDTGFKDWFEALQSMEDKIDSYDYDVALIGCGAYGMPLAAHCKRKGKIGIHMASWVQMLFGIYGTRWADKNNPYSKFINEYWVRPQDGEKPKNFKSVEDGAYW